MRDFSWYLREVITLASLAGCVWLLLLWIVPA
jgi:hypothetical protein